MKPVRVKKQTPIISKTYYNEYVCQNCQEKTKATVLWEQFISDNCVLMRVRCPKCNYENAPLVDRKRYKEHISDGNCFKNTP
jgi:hypothetical protein